MATLANAFADFGLLHTNQRFFATSVLPERHTQQQHYQQQHLKPRPRPQHTTHATLACAMWFSNYRQKLQLLLIVFFTFIAFGAADDAWMPWATLVVFLVMILLTDLLFLDASQFQYNPDYKNWARSVDPKY